MHFADYIVFPNTCNCNRTHKEFGHDTVHVHGPGSIVGIATGYGLGKKSRWGRDFPYLSRLALGVHPASCTMGTGSFPGVKSGRGMTLTPHPLLVLWSWKGRAIPLLPVWTVWPVQSLGACTRVHFTFTVHVHSVKISAFYSVSTFISTMSSWNLYLVKMVIWFQLVLKKLLDEIHTQYCT
jgi:hypothetical protein